MPVRSLPVDKPPRRVISLVPSLTESIFDLGLGDWLVGISDYCIHPAARLTGLPRVGGPKNPNIANILELAPDLVVANQEENSQPGIEALQRAGIPIWLTFPLTVAESLADLESLELLSGSETALHQILDLRATLAHHIRIAENRPRKRAFCPIWQDQTADGEPWWMTFNGQTYPGDLLNILGVDNVFHQRQRRYPLAAELDLQKAQEPAGQRDTRYPRFCWREILEMNPDLLLLPDEPYAFSQGDAEGLKMAIEEGLGHEVRVKRIDGSLLFWPGTRLRLALVQLGKILW